jgi:hypothetical protein
MRRAAALLLAVLPWAGPAPGAVFRCPDASGVVRFADSPDACPGAEPHTPADRVEGLDADANPGAGAPPAASADRGAPAPLPEQVLLTGREVGGGWDVVEEIPLPPEDDPDLVRWGVRALRTRHYTRFRGDRVEVCSIEVWLFESEGRARAALAGFAYPGWRIERAGPQLVMVRGLTRQRGERAQRGVFAACGGLGDRVRTRAARLSGP